MELPVALKPGLFGAAAGAVAMAVVGFSYLGWSTEATSDKRARDTADSAVAVALVPFCVLKARADPNPATITKFQAEQTSWSRSEIVMKAGWASLDGTTTVNDALARACAEKLYVAKTG